MTPPNLDLDTLRALVLAHDLGGYAAAACQLGRTPSAISLQMKRLQEDVGAQLFRKSGRGVALTEVGEVVLRYARQMLVANDELLETVRGATLAGSVRLGCSQDFAEPILPEVLAQFSQLYPLVQLELHIEGNAALVDAVERGKLDLALAIGHAERGTAELLGELELVWIAGRTFTPRPDQPLPLALLGPKCAFRILAIQALDHAGMPWRLSAVSPTVTGLWAAAMGGLGVTLRSPLGLPPALRTDKALFGLPETGAFPVTLHIRPEAGEAVDRLRNLLRVAVERHLGRSGKRQRTRRQTETGTNPPAAAGTR